MQPEDRIFHLTDGQLSAIGGEGARTFTLTGTS
jgi:hypothetical protein